MNVISRIAGGYNENGRNYVKIENSTHGFAGVYQTIYVDDTVSLELYFYSRGKVESGEMEIRIYDDDLQNLLYSHKYDAPSNEWYKNTIIIPPVKGQNKVALIMGLNGIGSIDLDESSCMPTNNVLGVRREYYDLLKDWDMGIFRYPGGSFADTYASFWHYGVGDIDKRYSPNIDPPPLRLSQRFDFGTIEFLNFCKLINTVPHITANYYNGWPELAGEWVEYCNGDTNTPFGKLRMEHGYEEPFDVKYWEVIAERIRKSIGAERTFGEDIHDEAKLLESLHRIAEILDKRIKKSNSSGKTLTLKIKYFDFEITTRSKTVFYPISDISEVLTLAQELFYTPKAPYKRVRLLGLSLSNLDNHEINIGDQLKLNFQEIHQ
jgi:hypothetical protein